jgi:hypothetical protein
MLQNLKGNVNKKLQSNIHILGVIIIRNSTHRTTSIVVDVVADEIALMEHLSRASVILNVQFTTSLVRCHIRALRFCASQLRRSDGFTTMRQLMK